MRPHRLAFWTFLLSGDTQASWRTVVSTAALMLVSMVFRSALALVLCKLPSRRQLRLRVGVSASLAMNTQSVPYRRNYGRVLVALAILTAFIYPWIPTNSQEPYTSSRALIGTLAVGIASLWAPTLVYCGWRTNNREDFIVGCLGTSTLLYWVPCVLLK